MKEILILELIKLKKLTDINILKMATKNGIGFSPLTDRVYLGKQNQEKGIWVGEKKDITSDFINVMFEYIPEGTSRTIRGLDTDSQNIFINIKKDKKHLENAIKFLNKQLKDL